MAPRHLRVRDSLPPLIAGAGIRLLVWSRMDTSWNDAYDYALNARFIREGEWWGVSRFMYSFYSVVVAAVDALVDDPVLAGEIVSLVAGIVTVGLVYALAERLAGSRAAVLAAWIAALHPRLVEYSTVGYTESLLTACVAGALLAAASYLVAPATEASAGARSSRTDLWAAGLFALAFLVRNDTLFYLVVGLVVLAIADLARDGVQRALQRSAQRGIVAGVLIVAATAFAWQRLGDSPLFAKAAANVAIGSAYDVEELGAWQEELYGVDEQGRLLGPPETPAGLSWSSRVRTYVENLMNLSRFYLLRLVFSPLVLAFAALGLLGTVFRRGTAAAEVLLVLAWLAPHVLYPLFIIQPQYLVQTLPVLAVWAGRGLVRFTEVVALNAGGSTRAAAVALRLAAIATLGPLIGGTALMAHERTADRGPGARVVGVWLARHAPEEGYLGSDPGFTYYSDNFDQQALPTGVPPEELGRVARANRAGVVVVTSGDVDTRPELAPLLEAEVTLPRDLRLELRQVDPHGQVIAIFRVAGSPAGSPPAS
ncbi:MAG: glycosyltransferase family 39 protein [Gemmatimonadota bacterium]